MLKQIINQYRKYKPSSATKNLCYHFLTRERKKSFGTENREKTFYVIRPINDTSPFYIGVVNHLLANYFYVLSHIQYSLHRGWIPIVDQLHYPVYTSSIRSIEGVQNAWEYFWQQPTHFTLDEVYRSKNVVLSKRSWFGQWDMGYDIRNHTNPDVIAFYHKLSLNVPLRDGIAQQVDETHASLFIQKRRTLGVAFRFGGHARLSVSHAQGHPITPDAETLVRTVRERCESWQMDYIFLASDEQKAVETFARAFGEKLLVLPRLRVDATMGDALKKHNPIYVADQLYTTTLNYLIEMELLSKCNGLVGTINSGLRYALVRNNNAYDHVEILDFGRFQDGNKRDRVL